jgi:hypothetical protein
MPVSFVPDRRGRPNSALYLNNSYISFPPNVNYFTGVDMSITFWLNTISISGGFYQFIMFMSEGSFKNAIYLAWANPSIMFVTTDSSSNFALFDSAVYSDFMPSKFDLNTWIFWCVTLDNSGNGNLYWNNSLIAAASTGSNALNSVVRNASTLGSDPSYSVTSYVDAIYDDLRFFTTVLTSNQMDSVMNLYE